MTFAVYFHLASGQIVEGRTKDVAAPDEWEEEDVEDFILNIIRDDLEGSPRWHKACGVLVYTQVVSAVTIDQIGGS